MKDFPWIVPSDDESEGEEEPKESEQKAEESDKDEDEEEELEETDEEEADKAKTWTLGYISKEDTNRGFSISITNRTLIFASFKIGEEIMRHADADDEEKGPKIRPICK